VYRKSVQLASAFKYSLPDLHTSAPLQKSC